MSGRLLLAAPVCEAFSVCWLWCRWRALQGLGSCGINKTQICCKGAFYWPFFKTVCSIYYRLYLLFRGSILAETLQMSFIVYTAGPGSHILFRYVLTCLNDDNPIWICIWNAFLVLCRAAHSGTVQYEYWGIYRLQSWLFGNIWMPVIDFPDAW